jgi:putative membrane-bound dehydrogenase-like protein
VPEGLEVTVWATSPALRNPTNIDFDEKGRLWVAEGVNYRSKKGRDPKGDRIVVLEDSDGDGKADKHSVFLQDPALASPLGVAVFENRVIVSQPPDLLAFTDVNGDGQFDPAVDRREVLLTGFEGLQHDHSLHSLHSLTAGPDGKWYWNQGNMGAQFTDKSGRTFRMGSPYRLQEIAGQKSDDGHVWIGGFLAKMNPDGSGVSILAHNFRNSYEQSVTSLGDIFQSDNDDPPACRVSPVLEGGNAGFCSADGKRAWQADRRPGQPVPDIQARLAAPGLSPAQRNQMLTALGFIPTKAAADAMLGIAANSPNTPQEHSVWWLFLNSQLLWKDHDVASGMKARGIYDPEKTQWVSSEPPPIPENASILPPPAEIAKLTGDPVRGAAAGGVCFMCHRIGATGIEFGPDLTTFASQQTREVLAQAIAQPSADIAHGYEGFIFKTADEKVIHGILVADGDPVVVLSVGGMLQRIPKAQIVSRVPKRPVSLMYKPAQLGLDAQRIADIIAWLKSLPGAPQAAR